MATVHTLGLVDLFVALLDRLALLGDAPARVLGGDALAAKEAVLAQGDSKSLEVAHQNIAPSRSRLRALTFVAPNSSAALRPITTTATTPTTTRFQP